MGIRKREHRPSAMGGWMTGLMALLLAFLLAYGFMRIFAPLPFAPPVVPYRGYASGPMLEAVDAAGVQAQVDALQALGSRFMGQPGARKAYARIRDAYVAAGLELLEIEEFAPIPVTVTSRIMGGDGTALDVPVVAHPLWPNTYQPMVTPPEGLRGNLLAGTSHLDRHHESLAGQIVVADLSDPQLRLNWRMWAMMGVEAILVTHADGLEHIPWTRDDVQALVAANNPFNLVRLAVTPEILALLGQPVRLHVRTEWRDVSHQTVIGVMRAPRPVTEALVITTSYDAPSLIPGVAYNPRSTVSAAMHLQLLAGLTAYQDTLQRDVYFVAFGGEVSASAGERTLLQFIGSHAERREIGAVWESERAANRRQSELVARVAAVIETDGFGEDVGTTERLLAEMDSTERTFFREQSRYVINTVAIAFQTEMLARKSIFEYEGGGDIRSRAFLDYLAANEQYNRVQARAGDSFVRLLSTREGQDSFAAEYAVVARLRERFAALLQHHAHRTKVLEAGLQVNDWFAGYQQITAFSAVLTPSLEQEGIEQVTFLNGRAEPRNDAVFADVLRGALFQLPEHARPQLHLQIGAVNAHDTRTRPTLGEPFSAFRGPDLWTETFGYPGFTLAHAGRKSQYDQFLLPFADGSMGSVHTMDRALAALGETVLSLAHGNGQFSLPRKISIARFDFTGNVYAAGVGRSIVPNFPMAGALVGRRHHDDRFVGRVMRPLVFSDPYGRYALRFTPLAFGPDAAGGYSPLAVAYDQNGFLSYIKDIGDAGQRIFASQGLDVWTRPQGGRDVSIVLFRAAPVTILDMVNPQTLRAFHAARAIRRGGLQTFDSMNRMDTPQDGVTTLFVPPAERFFVTFMAGAPDNETVQMVRAFTLGADSTYQPDADLEIDGAGYLAEFTPVLQDVPWHATRSMLYVNGRRLLLQRRYGMADELTLRFHARSQEGLAAAEERGLSYRDRLLLAREAFSYAILNHPVIRENVQEAVIGIIWYLGLLVPFILFFEKLVFGFADIRKQLIAHLVIFVAVFGLLRVLHPAFQMLRSSLMILLGFVIFMITTVVTLLLSGKFKENLEAIRQKQAKVKGAEVNTSGVLITAFMLGLNNMHRRKVRTGLTCATLVLLTFVMICFTSVQSNVVFTATAIGRASYQGLLIKNEEFAPIGTSERGALVSQYGHRYLVNTRSAYFGRLSWEQEPFNPEIRLATLPTEGDTARATRFLSALLFDYTEPLASQIEFVTGRGWFTREQQLSATGPVPIMIPESAALQLRVDPAAVDAGGVYVTVAGTPAEIVGIFRDASLSALRDLDYRDLLPFDVMAMQNVRGSPVTVLGDDDSPRMAASDVILSLHDRFPSAVTVLAGSDTIAPRVVSVAIELPRQRFVNRAGEALSAITFREAREVIEGYLERSGRQTFYGLDRFAYRGRRARVRTLSGLIDMLIPLFIAALTVVNTMRGSVYERRDEIFVYNAVGIAPRYVFFMFFAEAFVYSVVGSVLGYILSQGTGRLLTIMGWTGGLNMNFTSLATVYASLTIAGAVFLSTWFPARSAMEIAAPAEDSGWKLPSPEGDQMRFHLPFTFDKRDRIAVLGFFARYFDDHGEGSSGAFFAGAPQLGISAEPDVDGEGGPVPMLDVQIWLKPFDLGVSQRLHIALPTDPETGEYVAAVTLMRLSGSLESWERLVKRFVGRIRRHFLHWRAVTPDMKEDFFAEAEARLRAMEDTHG